MEKRRREILNLLNKEESPLKGLDLANIFNVTRQVIVQDIAILRAEGHNIIATNRGYIIPFNQDRLVYTIVCNHNTYEDMERELNAIVDNGGRVKDVIVEHPIYGEIKGVLELSNRRDVKSFVESVLKYEAEPLSSLTYGVHLHTIEVEDEDMLKNIKRDLKKIGCLTK